MKALLLALVIHQVAAPTAFIDSRRVVAQIEVPAAPAPDAGTDVPWAERPPVLIGADGAIVPIDGGVPGGTVCLTHDKAVIERDGKVACAARLATLEAGSGVDWPLLGIFTGAALLLGGVIGTGLGFALAPKR